MTAQTLMSDRRKWFMGPLQVADFARLVGTARYAPSQSERSVFDDFRQFLDEVERAHPGLTATVAKATAAQLSRPVVEK
jgi:hypothetical protein